VFLIILKVSVNPKEQREREREREREKRRQSVATDTSLSKQFDKASGTVRIQNALNLANCLQVHSS